MNGVSTTAIERVEFYRHGLGKAEVAAARRVLRSLFLTTGPETAAFEGEIAHWLEVEAAVALSSCTSAMQLALAGLGVGPGDEVITSPISFVSTANAILYNGATPVFADIFAEDGLIDPEAVEAAITPRTVGILPVHLYGQLCDMGGLSAIAKAKGLWIVEDAAHAVEARRGGHRPGSAGDVACMSFYATKNLSSGEGGLAACGDGELAKRLRRLRLHGIDRDASSRHGQRYVHWDQVELGFKANMSDLQAAILRAQIPGIEERLQRRHEIAARYEEAFTGLDGLRSPIVHAEAVSARHLYTIEVNPAKRDTVLWSLQERGVGVAVNFRPIHLMTYYRERFGFAPGAFPKAEALGASTISLPIYPGLRDDEQDFVIRNVREVMRVV